MANQLLTDGAKLFERGGADHVRERPEHENRKLKETIGELTVELKKTRRREKLLSACMSLSSKSSDWINALNEAVNLPFSDGIKEALYIPEWVSAPGCQPAF